MSATEATQMVKWSEEGLQRLRRLVKTEEASAWEIGDELLRLLPVGPVGVRTGVAATIRELAAEVDAEPKALTEYRNVAHAWPDTTRVVSATWAAHRAYCGPSASAAMRAQTLESLPRNEHGKITVQAVKDMTKGGGSGKPGWFQMLGQVGDTLIKAEKHLGKVEKAVTRKPNEKFQHKANEYATWADDLARRLRDLAEVQRGGGA